MAVPYAPRDYYHPQGVERLIDLVSRRGDIAAQGAINSGKIWGGAVGSLGEIAGQYFKDRQEKPLRDAKIAEIQSQIEFRKSQAQENTDQAEYRKFQMAGLKATQSKEEYNQYQHVMGQLGKGLYDASTEDPKGALPLFQQYHEVISQTAPKYLPIFEQFAADAKADPAKARKTAFDLWVNSPEVAKAKQTLAEKMAEPRVKAEDASLVTAGEDPFSYKPSKWEMPATSPAPPPSGPTLGDTATGGGRVLIPGTPKKPTQFELDKFENLKRHQKVMENKPVGVNPMSPTAEAGLIQKLSADWAKTSKPVTELTRQIQIMDSGLAAARRGDLNAAGQAVLVTFQKILDPISVVRESEYARSGAGQALLARMEGYLEKLMKGGAGVPLSELEKFVDVARGMAKAQMSMLPGQKARIAGVAKRYELPEELIFNEYDYDKAVSGQSQGGGASVLYRDAVNKSTGQKIKMKSVDGGTTWTPDQ